MQSDQYFDVLIAIPCLLCGGTEIQTLQIARVLLSTGYKVTVFCYHESDPEMVKQFRDEGVEVELLQFPRGALLGLLRLLTKRFRELKPDFIHVQYMAPGFVPVVAARLARVPRVLTTVHQPATPHGWKERMLVRIAARLCDRFICVSEAAAKSWFGNIERCVVIHNAVNVEHIDKIIGNPGRNGNIAPIVIGAVSRVRYEKGIDILLDAFTGITDARLLIVGDGPDRLTLEKRAIPNVEWTGQQLWERAIALMKAMDIVVVPSRFEGFGLTAAEAMACGKPVVATNVDGLKEVVQHQITGLLVPSEKPMELAAAIKSLLSDQELREKMGKAGRRFVREKFDYPIFRERYRVLYQNLV